VERKHRSNDFGIVIWDFGFKKWIKMSEQKKYSDKFKGTKWDYYRDIWCLGPSQNGYAGAFPRGLIKRIKEMEWWGEKRLWLFSGSYKDKGGTTVDIKPELKPDVVANCEKLPLETEMYDFVFLDPPYSEEEAKRLYGLGYVNILKVMNEAARVCEEGGVVILLHRLIPQYHPHETIHKKRLKLIGIIGIYTIAGYTNLRALTVWRKVSIDQVKEKYKPSKNQIELYDK
jgi:hypothetical protein